jgi:hypothetical protein
MILLAGNRIKVIVNCDLGLISGTVASGQRKQTAAGPVAARALSGRPEELEAFLEKIWPRPGWPTPRQRNP